MKVVEILLSETFSDYQQIILTHEKGLFDEFRRVIATDHPQWCFRSLQGDAKNGIHQKIEKDPIERATDYLHGHDLEAAAVQLRKAAESTADNYLKMATGSTPKPGDFHSLSEKLKKARKILANELPIQVFNQVCKDVPTEHRGKLIAADDSDLDGDETLDADTRERLKQHRQRMKDFMMHHAWSKLEAYKILDQVLRMKDRVLNPASHWNETPLYQTEIQKALKLIDQLEKILISAKS